MHYRKLTRNLIVSALGIGSSPFRNGTTKDCSLLLEQAYETGITYYDTARSYINGEEAVCSLAASIKNNMVITTKTGARGGKYCLRDLQLSLRTMKRDWIDIWMTHMIQTEHEYELCVNLGGFCDVAEAARNAGLIRATGASFHASTELILRAIEERAFDVVMFPFNIIGRETVFGSSISSYRDILFPAAAKNDVGIVVMKVLAGGELKHGAPGLDFLANQDCGRDSIGEAIRYSTINPSIATSVVGISNTDELVKNVYAIEGVDDNQLEEFEKLTDRVIEINRGECTRCAKCLSVCPQQIEIPKIMRLYDQYRFFRMCGVARYKYSKLKINAALCDNCGNCAVVCPEDFDISSLLISAHKELGYAQ